MLVPEPGRRAAGVSSRALAAGASVARGLSARLWRRTPPGVRPRWQYVDPLNRALLRLGAPVVAETRMCAGHRMRLDLRSGTEWLAYYTGAFDAERLEVARTLLRHGGAVVDAGANIGLWTVPLAVEAARKDAVVLAFEPVVANVERLTENLRINGVDGVVRVHRLALSDAPAQLTMTLREDFADGAGTGNASVALDDSVDSPYSTVDVQSVTLDDVLERAGGPRVDVLKVDVEGHEDRLLQGAQRTFREHRPVAFVEWNAVYYQRRGIDPTAAVTPLLADWDYRSLQMVDGRCRTGREFTSDKPLDDLVLVPAERQAEVELLMAPSSGSRDRARRGRQRAVEQEGRGT